MMTICALFRGGMQLYGMLVLAKFGKTMKKDLEKVPEDLQKDSSSYFGEPY